MLAVLALIAPAEATDVLLVEATPAAVDDFSVAGLFYSMVVSAAEERGLDFEDGDAIRRWAGADADTCWDVDSCPANLWDRTDARLALVMSVGRGEGGLVVAVRLHGAEETAPFKVLEELAGPGEESAVAARIARAAADALPLLPERPPIDGPVLVIDDEIVPGPPTRDRDRVVDDGPDDRPAGGTPERPERAPKPPAGDGRDGRSPRELREAQLLRERLRADDDRRAMGVPVGAYVRYQQSGLSRKEWLTKTRFRAGRGYLELNGGWGIGDVDRNYGVRLRIEESGGAFETIGTASIEDARVGAAPNFGVTMGYAPAWYLDTSVSLAFQYGRKYLDTGWECPERCDEGSAEQRYDVSAVQGVIEPRLRLYPVATGVVKPYGLIGFTVVVHDSYAVPDTSLVDYPDAPGGASFGPSAGLGLAIDVVSRVSIFGEVPATLLMSGPAATESGTVELQPDAFPSSGYYVRFVGGIAVRL